MKAASLLHIVCVRVCIMCTTPQHTRFSQSSGFIDASSRSFFKTNSPDWISVETHLRLPLLSPAPRARWTSWTSPGRLQNDGLLPLSGPWARALGRMMRVSLQQQMSTHNSRGSSWVFTQELRLDNQSQKTRWILLQGWEEEEGKWRLLGECTCCLHAPWRRKLFPFSSFFLEQVALFPHFLSFFYQTPHLKKNTF